MPRLFEKSIENDRVVYRLYGIKCIDRCPRDARELKKIETTKRNLEIQNKYDLIPLKNTSKLILFLVPPEVDITGGIMSIYSLCKCSREINTDALCLISTYPEPYTHAHNDRFLNNEQVYRFSQITDNCEYLDSLMIHIPEYYLKKFYRDLSKKDLKFLKSVKNLHISILNQNIDEMARPKVVNNFRKLTHKITQTIAHDAYATQEICNKYNIPTHLASVSIDLSPYKVYPFEEKEKIIVLSPDNNEYRNQVVNVLKEAFPDWRLLTVNNMTFSEYMSLIGRAFFTITFGEGMDGYFLQPEVVGSIGFAVYNERFFPNDSWNSLKNVYNSYEEMVKEIADFMRLLLKDRVLYEQTVAETLTEMQSVYKSGAFKDNLERFYKEDYDFIPGEC